MHGGERLQWHRFLLLGEYENALQDAETGLAMGELPVLRKLLQEAKWRKCMLLDNYGENNKN